MRAPPFRQPDFRKPRDRESDMKKRLDRSDRFGRRAFTMIELMVVVSIIAILIGGVFKIFRTVQDMNAKATTIARMQCIQNAISAFYAEYGYYPPVPRYSSPDPWKIHEDDYGVSIDTSSEEGFANACSKAASSQSVTFEFPPKQSEDPYINQSFRDFGIQSANSVLGGTADTITQESWPEVKMFKFGLLSYLLPRLETVGFSGNTNPDTESEPDLRFYESRQWKKNNPVSGVSNIRKALEAQKITENRAAARWLPNLEGIVDCGKIILGVDTADKKYNSGVYYTISTSASGEPQGYTHGDGGGEYLLKRVNLNDGWRRGFYYFSSPPYQSYQLWSAGDNGRTFPPWIPLNGLTDKERAWVADWIKDDIVRFDH